MPRLSEKPINTTNSINTTTNIASRDATPIETHSSQTVSPSESSLLDAFGRIIGESVVQSIAHRDKYKRPLLLYNDKYDPYKPTNSNLPVGYTLYAFREPLFDNREAIVTRFLPNHVLAGPSKKPRTSWVWKVGYAFRDNRKPTKPLIWGYKLCKFKSLILGDLVGF